MLEVYTVSELMNVAAEALANRDIQTLESLINRARDWMQPHDETEAQVNMLESMIEAVYDLEACEA
jgi:hypothetical protein